ncbi:MAG TPA: ORF6N domain-containing protein [Nitrospiria bacterium]|nr:ORF6N domain-containing protein [Nitrospiria bacterium]
MLDADLAELYGVTTKRLNEQVNRNRRRFPGDFSFHSRPRRRPRWSHIATTSRTRSLGPRLRKNNQ